MNNLRDSYFDNSNFSNSVLKNINFTKNEPVSVVHFLTNRCNARCSFCFIDFDDPNTFKNEHTLDEIENALESNAICPL